MKKIIILLLIFLKINNCFSQNENIENINIFNYVDVIGDRPMPTISYTNDLVIKLRSYYNDEIKYSSENSYGDIKVFLIYKHGTIALRDTALKRYPDKIKSDTYDFKLVNQIFTNNDFIKTSDFDIYMMIIKRDELIKDEALDGTPDPGKEEVKDFYFWSKFPHTEYYYYKKRGENKFTFYNKIAVNSSNKNEEFFYKWMYEVALKSNEEYLKQIEKNKK